MAERYIDPTREEFAQLRALPRDHPIEMLNLVRLRDSANYPDGREATGAEAYAAYGRESGPIFRKVGGKIVWSGDPQFMVIGPPQERWDIAFIARYPTGQAFLDMVYTTLAIVGRAIALAKGASSLQSWLNSLTYCAEAETIALW